VLNKITGTFIGVGLRVFFLFNVGIRVGLILGLRVGIRLGLRLGLILGFRVTIFDDKDETE
jgi:hypothetical protein